MSKWMWSVVLFFLLWFIVFAFYFKTAGAGFVTDEIGWLQTYSDIGWQGIFDAFGDKSLHYGYHLIGFLLWKSFGLNGIAWMLVFVTIHTAVAFLSFDIFENLLKTAEVTSAQYIAFAGSLLFAISPYQTEPLVWYACIHYLVCSFLLLLAFRFLLLYIDNRQVKYVVLFYVCFVFALFTLEISFAFPVLLLVFLLFWQPQTFEWKQRSHLIKTFVAPSFLLLGGYFLLSSILRGSAVGHYGAAQHLNFSIPLLMANLSKYTAKIFLLSQFTSFEYRNYLYLIFEKEKFCYLLFTGLLIAAGIFLFFNKKMKDTCRLIFLLFSFFAIALLPILNLYFSYIVNIEGDRFTYFASVFAYQFVAVASVVIFRKFGWLIVAAMLFFHAKFLYINTESWKNSNTINQSLTSSFKWFDAPKIYLLNLPDNFKGAYMFRASAPDNSFVKTLTLRGNPAVESKTSQVMNYNMNLTSDSVTVEKISENELKVTFAQGGNWWWNEGIGARDYSTKEYDVKIDESSSSYLLKLKRKEPNAVYLYQCGGHWRVVENF